MPDYGIKISKSTFDVGTSTDKNNIMSSKYPVYKLFSSGQGTLVKSGGNAEVYGTITHNLGYSPICFVFGQYLDENTGTIIPKYKDFSWFDTPGLHFWDRYSYTVGTSNLIVGFTTDYWGANSLSIPYIYYIFYDQAT